MPKSLIHFRPDSADHLINRYLSKTILRFDKEMGKRLAEVRKKMLVTQSQLADQLSLTQTDVSRLEAGKKVNALPTSDLFKTVLEKYFEFVVFGGALLQESELSVEYHKQTKKWWAVLKR